MIEVATPYSAGCQALAPNSGREFGLQSFIPTCLNTMGPKNRVEYLQLYTTTVYAAG